MNQQGIRAGWAGATHTSARTQEAAADPLLQGHVPWDTELSAPLRALLADWLCESAAAPAEILPCHGRDSIHLSQN